MDMGKQRIRDEFFEKYFFEIDEIFFGKLFENISIRISIFEIKYIIEI